VVSANANSVASKYKYNGTELEESLGLDLYEMPMRQYDPAIARWTAIDPVVHWSKSTYTAFDNNPIIYSDPSGADSYRYDWATGTYVNRSTNEKTNNWQMAVSETQSKMSKDSPSFKINVNNPESISGAHVRVAGEVAMGVQFKEGQKLFGFGEKLDVGVYKVVADAELLWSPETGFILNLTIPKQIQDLIDQDHNFVVGYHQLGFGGEFSGTFNGDEGVTAAEFTGSEGPFKLTLSQQNSNVGFEIYSGSHTIGLFSFSGSASIQNVQPGMRQGSPADGMATSKSNRDAYLRMMQHNRVDYDNKKWILLANALRELKKL
jgi:RHS repeat-associated protein